MRDHLRPVRLFGRDYYWHREPGQPLELLPAMSLPVSPAMSPEDLYEAMTAWYGRPLPWPMKEESGA